MDSHFSESIDLDNIADEAYFSKFHFIRLFKTIYRQTPHQYLIQVRVERAKELLRQGRSVSETCAAVGFESITSFTGLFKKLTHQSPSVFQAAHFKRADEIRKEPLQFIPNCFAEQKGWTKKSNFQEVL